MRGLIGQGSLYRQRATKGYGAVAQIDEKEAQIRDGIKVQEKAQDAATMGQGAGFGAMYGMNKAYGANKTAGDSLTSLNKMFSKSGGEFAFEGGGLNFTPKGGEVITGVENMAGLESGVPDIASTLVPEGAAGAAGAEVAAGAVEGGAAVVEGAAATAEAAALADAAIIETAGLASSQSALATIGTIAAPVAIGLAVAGLFNEFF
tara:strand:+ start:4334 stop:4948 length:615 start_codon:yes stop_codon:yes gene_type:complete